MGSFARAASGGGSSNGFQGLLDGQLIAKSGAAQEPSSPANDNLRRSSGNDKPALDQVAQAARRDEAQRVASQRAANQRESAQRTAAQRDAAQRELSQKDARDKAVSQRERADRAAARADAQRRDRQELASSEQKHLSRSDRSDSDRHSISERQRAQHDAARLRAEEARGDESREKGVAAEKTGGPTGPEVGKKAAKPSDAGGKDGLQAKKTVAGDPEELTQEELAQMVAQPVVGEAPAMQGGVLQGVSGDREGADPLASGKEGAGTKVIGEGGVPEGLSVAEATATDVALKNAGAAGSLGGLSDQERLAQTQGASMTEEGGSAKGAGAPALNPEMLSADGSAEDGLAVAASVNVKQSSVTESGTLLVPDGLNTGKELSTDGRLSADGKLFADGALSTDGKLSADEKLSADGKQNTVNLEGTQAASDDAEMEGAEILKSVRSADARASAAEDVARAARAAAQVQPGMSSVDSGSAAKATGWPQMLPLVSEGAAKRDGAVGRKGGDVIAGTREALRELGKAFGSEPSLDSVENNAADTVRARIEGVAGLSQPTGELASNTAQADPKTVTAGITPAVSSSLQGGAATSATVANGLPISPDRPGFAREIAERILMMTTKKVHSAEIRLDPKELGAIDVKIRVHQDQASITFTTPHAHVRDALEMSLPRLREMFNDAGVGLGSVNVSDRDGASGGAGDRQPRDQGSDRGFAGTGEDGVDEVAVPKQKSARKGAVDFYA
ncbi:Similar to flagellar hook-length control protein [gamma proteobacterium HdN1]|nr:Similar to flagellar hook-length control protein [gamma proteobacterium HdN1]